MNEKIKQEAAHAMRLIGILNVNGDAVDVIDTATDRVIARAPVGQAPQALVYVSNAVPSGTVWPSTTVSWWPKFASSSNSSSATAAATASSSARPTWRSSSASTI